MDAASEADLRETGTALPLAKMSIHAAAWQGTDDRECWATIMDQADHLGQAWIMFHRGEDEKAATRFRIQAMRHITARWPDTLSLPVIDRSTIPLHRDLVKTPEGYRLNPSAVSRYKNKPAA